MRRFILLSTTLLCFMLATSQTKQEADSLIMRAVKIIKTNSDVDLALNLLKQSEDYYLPTCGENSLEMARIWHYEARAYALKEEFFLGCQASEKAWKIAFDSLGYEAPFTQEILDTYSDFCTHDNHFSFSDPINGKAGRLNNWTRLVNDIFFGAKAGLYLSVDTTILIPAVFVNVEIDSTAHFATVADGQTIWIYDLEQRTFVCKYPHLEINHYTPEILFNDSSRCVFKCGSYLFDNKGNIIDNMASSYYFSSLVKDSIKVDAFSVSGDIQYLIHKSQLAEYRNLGNIFPTETPKELAHLKYHSEIGGGYFLVTGNDGTKLGLVHNQNKEFHLDVLPQYDTIQEIGTDQELFLLSQGDSCQLFDTSLHQLEPMAVINETEELSFHLPLCRFRSKVWFTGWIRNERLVLVNSAGEAYKLPIWVTLWYDKNNGIYRFFDGQQMTNYSSDTIHKLIQRVASGEFESGPDDYTWKWIVPNYDGLDFTIDLQLDFPQETSSMNQRVRGCISEYLYKDFSFYYPEVDSYPSWDDTAQDGMCSYYLNELLHDCWRDTLSMREAVSNVLELDNIFVC